MNSSLFGIALLGDDDVLAGFCSGDDDLDAFLRDDARRFQTLNLALTYLARYSGELVGYVTILADTAALGDGDRKKIHKEMRSIRYPIPALKVARLAMSLSFKEAHKGGGTRLMRLVYDLGAKFSQQVGCRLLTVDAYAESIGFYASLGFIQRKTDKQTKTTPMYFDLHQRKLPAWAAS